MADETEFVDDSQENSPVIPTWDPTSLAREELGKDSKKAELPPLPQKKKPNPFKTKLISFCKAIFSIIVLLILLTLGFLFFPDGASSEELIKEITYAGSSASHSFNITIYPIVTGYYKVPNTLFKTEEKLPILAFLIEHSEYGKILYNTGLGEGFEERLKNHKWLAKKFNIEFKSSIKTELAKKGITPDQIDKIVLGSLEWQNADGILDFPNTKTYVQGDEYHSAKSYSSFYPRFWSEHMKKEFEQFGFPPQTQEFGFLSFDTSLRLGNDLEAAGESLVIVPTPGATKGHCSLVVTFKNNKRVILTGDSVWVPSQIEKKEDLPKMGRKFLRNNAKNALKSICQFWKIQQEESSTIFLCAHDPELGKISFPAKKYEVE